MELREYRQSDCKELVKLFYNTVRIVNAKDYTEEQLNVWATGKMSRWSDRFGQAVYDGELTYG